MLQDEVKAERDADFQEGKVCRLCYIIQYGQSRHTSALWQSPDSKASSSRPNDNIPSRPKFSDTAHSPNASQRKVHASHARATLESRTTVQPHIRLIHAIQALEESDGGQFNERELLHMVELFRKDLTIADAYLAISKPSLRRNWLRSLLTI